MNWLDILLLILVIVVVVLSFIWMVWGVKEDEIGCGVVGLFVGLGVAAFIGCCAWLKTDFKSGQTVGEITSVDRNFFGTTAVYIKTTNNQEEKYCVEDSTIASKVSEMIGKKVKVTYGKRVGIYSTGRCDDAPIDSIEVVE